MSHRVVGLILSNSKSISPTNLLATLKKHDETFNNTDHQDLLGLGLGLGLATDESICIYRVRFEFTFHTMVANFAHIRNKIIAISSSEQSVSNICVEWLTILYLDTLLGPTALSPSNRVIS